MKPPLRISNTLSKKKEVFSPLNPPKVLFYSCGPTVYGPLHIGNARALLFADFFYKLLKHLKYDVQFVRNYTDVDDKIIERAKQENISALDVAQKYIDYCEKDIALLGLAKPSKTARVTESIQDIIQLIQKIIENGHAYIVDGEVLFSVHAFTGYGKLSGKHIDDLQAGARVEIDTKKKNPLDFALWKPYTGDPHWDSPWGKGRPGWHIECSAMVGRYLGMTIDIHHGGQDLIFPHHENEIAQSESATGKTFCNYWLHHAFLNMKTEKMSKSLGNILTIREFIEKYGAELLRFLYISHHFRSPVEYSPTLLKQSLDELERVYILKKWAKENLDLEMTASKKSSEHLHVERATRELGDACVSNVLDAGATREFGDASVSNALGVGKRVSGANMNATKSDEVFQKMEEDLLNDLNSPGALGHLFTWVREINRNKDITHATDFYNFLNNKIFPIFNVFGDDPETALAQIQKNRKSLSTIQTTFSEEQIQSLINERTSARKNKDFKRADEIRKQLDEQGIEITDSPTSTAWQYK